MKLSDGAQYSGNFRSEKIPSSEPSRLLTARGAIFSNTSLVQLQIECVVLAGKRLAALGEC
jgi:hypothetical protein